MAKTMFGEMLYIPLTWRRLGVWPILQPATRGCSRLFSFTLLRKKHNYTKACGNFFSTILKARRLFQKSHWASTQDWASFCSISLQTHHYKHSLNLQWKYLSQWFHSRVSFLSPTSWAPRAPHSWYIMFIHRTVRERVIDGVCWVELKSERTRQ